MFKVTAQSVPRLVGSEADSAEQLLIFPIVCRMREAESDE